MTALVPKTNGDVVVQPILDRAKKLAAEAFEYFQEHPDEVAIGLAPLLMLAMATRRHKLNWAEAFLVSEIGFWSGAFAVKAYLQWKDEPAGTVPRLRKVT